MAVGALIGGASAGAYYTATNWGDWDGWEFATAVAAGGLAGAIGAGTGAFVGSLFTSPFWGAVVGGAAGGAVGGPAGYTLNYGRAKLHGQDVDFTEKGLGMSALIGGGIGALAGLVGWGATELFSSSEDPGQMIDAPDKTFASTEEAGNYMSAHYTDRAIRHDQEFRVDFIENTKTGEIRLSDIQAGEPGSGEVIPARLTLAAHERHVGSWHVHPEGGPFSEGFYQSGQEGRPGSIVEGGDIAVNEYYNDVYPHEYRSYVATEGNLRSIGPEGAGAANWGRFESSLWYYRPTAFVPGAVGTSAGQLALRRR